MRIVSRMSLAITVAALLSGRAVAQNQVQPAQPAQPEPTRLIAPGVMNNPQLILLNQKPVQEDLKLTNEQTKKVGELQQKQRAALKGANPRERLAKMKEVNDAIQKDIKEMLKPEQSKRLGQLQVQQRGLNAFFDPQIAKDLGLTPDQQRQVREAIQGVGQQRQTIIQANQGNAQAIRDKLAELDKATMEGIVRSLTDEQRTKWKGMAGEPFKGVLPGAGPGLIRPLPIQRPGIQPLPPVRIQPLPRRVEKN
ncbi:MAG: hypothetical protein L0Z62_17350 [Gemmataceae bacterium]|nr:hypothetical protein [Gemmataceae bacterium]